MKKKRTEKKKGVGKLKKKLAGFLMSEEGKITPKDIAKLGITLGTLSAMFQDDLLPSAEAVHISNFFTDALGGGHNSTNPHASHGSHGSHGQW